MNMESKYEIIDNTKESMVKHKSFSRDFFLVQENIVTQFRSTETTILSLFDELCNSLDTGKPIQLILLNLSFAFNTPRHDILLERNIGIQDKTMEWFSNCIIDRNYSIKIRNNYSTLYRILYRIPTIDHSVPQGSIFSPILFSIYYSITNNYETLSIYYLQLIRK